MTFGLPKANECILVLALPATQYMQNKLIDATARGKSGINVKVTPLIAHTATAIVGRTSDSSSQTRAVMKRCSSSASQK